MEEETLTPEAQPAQADSDGTGSEPQSDSPDQGAVDKVNEELNKNFKSPEDLAKSYSEATKKIGEQGNQIKELQEKIENVIGDNKENLGAQLENLKGELSREKFYQANPEYDTPEVRKILGTDPNKSLEDGTIKSATEKIVEASKQEKSRSVLHSNPRLGQVQDKMGKAKEGLKGATEALKSGNVAEANRLSEGANNSAVNAVLDAYSE